MVDLFYLRNFITMTAIIPSTQLLRKWGREWIDQTGERGNRDSFMAAKISEWVASQETEAQQLRAARSPSPTLKEQALDALGPEPLPETGPTGDTILNAGAIERHRRALENLPNEN
jgi:hypothetical protein